MILFLHEVAERCSSRGYRSKVGTDKDLEVEGDGVLLVLVNNYESTVWGVSCIWWLRGGSTRA